MPTFSNCPADVSVNVNPSSSTGVASWTEPTATDNSGAVDSLVSDYSPGDSFPIGTTPVTYTATDIYGNADTCTFNVIVAGKSDLNIFCYLKGWIIHNDIIILYWE